MWVFNKSFENIDENDVRALLDNGITEEQNLEYKLEFGQSDDEKKKKCLEIFHQ